MANAETRGWGPGWPNCQISNIVAIRRDDGVRIGIHYRIALLTKILLDLTEAAGYDIDPTQTWGYACRAIRGTSIPSNHSWGLAVDINSIDNPQKRPLTTNLPPNIVQIWKDHGFGWGGDYKISTPDPMHFEFMGTPTDADVITKRLIKFLTSSEEPIPGGFVRVTVDLPQIQEGSNGMQVAMYQRVHNLKNGLPTDGRPALEEDGAFGPHTKQEVIVFQQWYGLVPDGIVGANTWAAILGYSE